MKVRPIMLGRAAYLTLYAEVLRELGSSVDREFASAGLPTTFQEHPNAYVPVCTAIRCIRKLELNDGIEDLGFLAAQKLAFTILGAELKEAILEAPTLYEGLRRYCRFVHSENTHIRAFVVPTRLGVQVRSELAGYEELDGLHLSEWLLNFAVIAIVRQFAGQRWYPTTIAFQSRIEPGQGTFERLPNTRLFFGREAAGIDVPAALLSLPLRFRRCDRKPGAATRSASISLPDPELDFAGSLKLMLRAYRMDGHPCVGLAAEIAGTSVRTLQRRLARFGLTYSHLVSQVQFETAAELLKDPDTKIIEVAFEVGYEDPAHFARAFKRIAGVSPREFRRESIAPPSLRGPILSRELTNSDL